MSRGSGRWVPAVALGISLMAAAACSRPKLIDTSASPHALVEQVLDALQRRDADRLRHLAVTESEFRDVVWPELPAARPERNLPMDYVWKDLRAKSESGLQRLLAEHGGKPWTLVQVDFTGGTTQHRTYLVRRGATVTARDTLNADLRLRLFGSVLERDGRFKVFSYVVD